MFGRFLIGAVIAGLACVSAGGAQAAPAVVLGGGSGIVVDGSTLCTLTTIGWDAQGRLVGFTAGHCAEAGSTVTAETARGAGTVGTVVALDILLDYAVIQFDPDLVVPTHRVGSTAITGIGAPARFPAIACKEGRTTGQTCGLVYGDVFDTHTWTLTQICVNLGDSGGPVVVGTTLVGMVNGFIALPCLGPQVGVDFATILEDVGTRGAVGAGFRPV